MNVIKTQGKILVNSGHIIGMGRTLSFSASSTVSSSTFGFNANNTIGIGIDREGGRIFVANNNKNTVDILNYSTLAVIDTITQAQGTFSAPTGIAVDKAGSRIFVCNGGNSTLSVLPYATPKSGATVIGGISSPRGIALDATGSRIFVTGNSTVYILNYATPSTTPAIIPQSFGSFWQSSGIEVDPLGKRIFVPNWTGGSSNGMTVLDYDNPATVTPLIISATALGISFPCAVAVDRNNNRMFVVGNTSGFSIVNYTNPSSGVYTIVLGATAQTNGSMGVALDSFSNRLIIANGNASAGLFYLSIITNQFT